LKDCSQTDGKDGKMKTRIKMPMPFHGNYIVSIITGETEDRARCQRLFIRELSEETRKEHYKGVDEKDVPTHQVSFHDFGCRRIVEGKLKENEENIVSFETHGKTYRFSPLLPKHQ